MEDKIIIEYENRMDAATILAQARAGAQDPARLGVADLAPFDEMHIGARRATLHLFAAMGLEAGMRVLDIGSGIGGPARVAAEMYKVHVTGIDLTPAYREAAQALSTAAGVENTEFITGNALTMPFEDAGFDAAYSIHAAMNIADKQGLYLEAARVLKPGAAFGIYDVMAGEGDGAPSFPLPWAQTADTSFLIQPRAVASMLESAGFRVLEIEDRSAFALGGYAKLRAMESFQKRTDGFPLKMANVRAGIEKGFCAPVQIICRKDK